MTVGIIRDDRLRRRIVAETLPLKLIEAGY